MPSTNDPTELLVAGDGRLIVADPDDTPTMPTSEDDSVVDSSPWIELGYVTTDGVNYQDSFTQELLRAWQSVGAIRTLATERNPQLTFSLMQWDTANLILAFGGGSVDSDGVFTGPLASDQPVERSVCLDAIDGDTTWRFVFPRTGLAQGSSFSLTRTTSANLSIVLSILDPGGDDPLFSVYSNSDGLATLGS
jgi:hypothetical protein